MVFKAHFIHVGNMNNKGTQALFASDVYAVKAAVVGAVVSVSTPDVWGVKKLGLPLTVVLPPMIDIPYNKADQICKLKQRGRSGFYYKTLTLAILVLMPVQMVFSLLSVFMGKAGLKPFYRGDVIEQMKASSVVISHSDENFKETASSLPLNLQWALTWWSMLLSRTLDVMVARSFGKPVVLFPNSVGPFRTGIGKFLAKLSLNSCDYLLIRDPISFSIVDQLGIKTTKVLTYDTALLFQEQSRCSVAGGFSKPLLGVSAGIYSNSLSQTHVKNYITAHAKALDAAIQKYGFTVLFLPHYVSGFSNDDLDVSNQIRAQMQNQHQTAIVTIEEVSEFHAVLGEMDLVLSSKMHPAILAATSYVPVLCVVYDHKRTGFFQRLEMTQCTLDIREVSFEKLSSRISGVWAERDALHQSLSMQIPQWQQNVSSVIKRTVQVYANRKEAPK